MSSFSSAATVCDPLFRIAVVQERHPVDDRVAGGQHLLLRQVDEQVAVGVAPGRATCSWISRPPSCRVVVVDTVRVGSAGLSLLSSSQIGLGLLQVGLEARLRRRVGRLGDVVLQLVDLARQRRDLLLDERHAAVRRVGIASGSAFVRSVAMISSPGLPCGVDLVALPVIPVEVRVDDLAHRLLADALDLLVERPRRRGLGVRVDDDRCRRWSRSPRRWS